MLGQGSGAGSEIRGWVRVRAHTDKEVHEAFYGKYNEYFEHVQTVCTTSPWGGRGLGTRLSLLHSVNCVQLWNLLEVGICERIVETIFECTEHHQTIATFRSRKTFCRHTVLDTLYKTDKCKCSQWCLNTKLAD